MSTSESPSFFVISSAEFDGVTPLTANWSPNASPRSQPRSYASPSLTGVGRISYAKLGQPGTMGMLAIARTWSSTATLTLTVRSENAAENSFGNADAPAPNNLDAALITRDLTTVWCAPFLMGPTDAIALRDGSMVPSTVEIMTVDLGSDSAVAYLNAVFQNATAADALAVAEAALATAEAAQVDADAALSGLALKANISSPSFTDEPKAPTAPPGTNTAQLATTEFVGAAVSTAAPVGPSGNVLVSNGVANVSTTISALFSNTNQPQLFDLMTDPAVSGWARVLSGTGQLSSVSATTPSHPGQWQALIGTGLASRAGVYLGPATGGLLVPSVSSVGFFEVMLRINTISTGLSSFDTYIGFADEPASAAAFNGVYFYIDIFNNLRARRNVGGVLSNDVVVLAPVAGLWYRLRATYSAGSVVLSYAQTEDRSLPLTTALTVPIVVLPQSPQSKIVRQTGVVAASVTWDYLSYYLPKV